MPRRKSPPEPRKRSGADPEWARKTRQTKLRLQPEDAELLEARAKARGLSVSGYVAELVRLDAAEARDEEWRTWPARPVQPHERER